MPRSIFQVWVDTRRAREWVDEYVMSDGLWFGNSLVVDARHVGDLVAGMLEAGLVHEQDFFINEAF